MSFAGRLEAGAAGRESKKTQEHSPFVPQGKQGWLCHGRNPRGRPKAAPTLARENREGGPVRSFGVQETRVKPAYGRRGCQRLASRASILDRGDTEGCGDTACASLAGWKPALRGENRRKPKSTAKNGCATRRETQEKGRRVRGVGGHRLKPVLQVACAGRSRRTQAEACATGGVRRVDGAMWYASWVV
jgi:hypothetical protein